MGTRKQSARLRQKTLERLHASLIARHRLLLENNAAQVIGNRGNPHCDTADMTDLAAMASDQEIYCHVAESHWQELVGIRAAFRRIEDGTYGICEECGAHIPVARLRALPYVRLCLHCQVTLERLGDVEDGAASWEAIRASCGNESPSQFHSIGATARLSKLKRFGSK